MLQYESKSSSSFLPSSLSSSSSSAEIMQPKPKPLIKVEDEIQFSSCSASVAKFDVRVKAEDALDKEKEEDIFQRLSQLLNEPDAECTNTIGTTFEQQNVEFELKQEEEEQEDVWMVESEHNIPDPDPSGEPNFNLNEMDLSPKINLIPSNPTSTNFGSPSPVSTKSNSNGHVFRDGRRTYKVYRCDRCPYKTSYENHLATHLRTHKSTQSSESSSTKKKTRRFPCHLCSVTTSTTHSLRKHVQGAHSTPFKCPQTGCDYTTTARQINGFKRHLQMYHSKSTLEIERLLKSSSFSSPSSTSANQGPEPVELQPEFSSQFLTTTTTTEINMIPSTNTNFSTPILVSIQSNCPTDNFPSQGGRKIRYKVYKCDWCTYKTNYEYHLQTHLRTHKSAQSAASSSTKETATRFPCHLCSMTTSTIYSLRNHIQGVHSSPFKCQESGCDYTSKKNRKHNFKIHLRYSHLKSPQEIETILKDALAPSSSSSSAKKDQISESDSSTKNNNLITTTNMIPSNPTTTSANFSSPTPILVSTQSNCPIDNFPHLGPPKISYKVYKCDGCDYKTNYEYHLQAHLRTHKSSPTKKTTRRTFPCHLCSVMAHTTFNLKKHMQNVHEAHEKCELECSESGCGYTTKNTSTLKLHAFSRHGKMEEDLKLLTCSLCPYKTVEKTALQQHVDNVHVRILTFACHVCPFKTGGKGHFQRHFALVHPKLRPYKCPEIGSGCDYAAKEEISFKKHMRASHKKSQKEINKIWKDVSSYYNSLVVRVPTSKSKLQSESESESESELLTKATTNIETFSKNVEAQPKSNLKSKRVKSCKIANAILFECENCEFYTKQQKQIAAHLYNQHNLPRVTLQLQLFKEKLKRS